MRFKALILIPIVWIAIFIIADVIVYHDVDATTLLHRIQIELSRIVWLFGCLIAAFSFERGEYLRRAWLFFSGCPLVLIFFDIGLLLKTMQIWPDQIDFIRGVLVVVANVFGVISIIMLANAWKVAGIELPGSKSSQMAFRILLLIVALLVAGPGGISSLMQVAEGQGLALIGIGSALGDIVSLAMIAPLLMTAAALRGGMVSWPWIFFTMGSFGWLFWDALTTDAPTYLGMDDRLATTFAEIARCIGSGYMFTAGLAQYLVVKHIHKTRSR